MNNLLSEKLWSNHKGQAIMAQYTPFIISLAAGTLPVNTFEGYLYQDIYYLRGYAKAAYEAKKYATDKEVIDELQTIGDHSIRDIDLYAPYFQDLGLTYIKDKFPMNEATSKYINFLLNAAKTKRPINAFAAMTPCERIYSYLGWMIKHALSEEELQANKYKRWIIDNSSQDLEAPKNRRTLKSTKTMEYFINKLSAGLPQQELNEIEMLYGQGLEHETDFNLAQQIDGQGVVVPLWKELKGLNISLFSDFDLCCTKPNSDRKRLQDYEQLIAKKLQQDNPQAKSYSFAKIQKAFESVCELEKKSFPHGVSFGNFMAESGYINFVKNIRCSTRAYVISAYWSDDKIKSWLIKEHLAPKISHVGNKGSVESSIDKLEAFHNQSSLENLDKRFHLRLYIGDSVGDLLCLLNANIGFVYQQPNVSLSNVGKHFSVSFVPLFKGVIHMEMNYKKRTPIISSLEPNPSLLPWKPIPGVIYSFSDWAEIVGFTFGASRYSDGF